MYVYIYIMHVYIYPQNWHVVSSSACLWTAWSTKCIEVGGREFSTSKTRNFEHFIDLEIDWFHKFSLLSRVVCVIVCVCVNMHGCVCARACA